MIFGVPSSLQNNQIFAQLTNDRDNDGLIDDEDPCPDSHRLIASCPADNSFSSSSTEDQVSVKECVVSSSDCTVTDILINENGQIVCDPRQFDCSSYLTSSNSGIQGQGQAPTQNTAKPPQTLPKTPTRDPSLQGGKSCNPDNSVCSLKDVLINNEGEVICDPTKTDCSSYFSSNVELEPTYQMFTICNPNFEPCKTTDVIVDANYYVLCNPLEGDCSAYLVSGKEPLEKYTSLTGGNPNAGVLHATDPPLQYCNPRGENCTPNYRQIPGMQPWHCFTIITTDQKVCDNTPRPTSKYKSLVWTIPPRPPYKEFLEAQEKEIELRNERAQFENFACEFADQASEKVVAFASCWKVGAEGAKAGVTADKYIGPGLSTQGLPTAGHVSKSEMAFCGLGTANVAKNGFEVDVEGHETSALQVLDVPSYVGGKASKLTCKVTGSVSSGLGLRDKLYEWFGRGDGKIVAKFLNEEAERIEKEMPKWCAKYGATVSSTGNCYGLEIEWEDCFEAQRFWFNFDPEKYGRDKPIKLRDGSVVKNARGIFEFPCSFPPIPSAENQICTPERNTCGID